MVYNLKLSYHIICVLTSGKSQEGLELWPKHKFPFPSSSRRWNIIFKQLSLAQGQDQMPICPWMASFSSLPAPKMIQTSRSHPPMGKRGFTMLQGYTTAFACSFCFQYSHMFLYGIQCSPFTGFEYMWLTYIWWFHLSGVGSPFLVNLKNWKHMAWNFLLYIIANIKQDMYQNVHFSIDFNNNNLKIT